MNLSHALNDTVAPNGEAPVDPSRRIVDAHHHLWDVGDGPSYLQPRYLIDDLVGDAAGFHVTDTVYVQATQVGYRPDGPEELRPAGQTGFVADQARTSPEDGPRVSAIVGFADMTRGDAVEEVLAAHEAAGDGRFRGIRHSVAVDPSLAVFPDRPPGMLLQDGFRRALACVGRHGYTFDAWVYHPQLPELAETMRAVEGTVFVVNHLGGPVFRPSHTDRDAELALWQAGIREVATCPNAVLKLGAIGMDVLSGREWTTRDEPPGSDEVADRWRDQVRWSIDTLGPDRCMFESNFPVDRIAMSYTVLWNAFQKIASVYSDEEQDELFSGTASRAYRIA